MRSSLGHSFLFIMVLLTSVSAYSASWVHSYSKRFATTSGLLVLAAAVDIIKHDDRAQRTGDVDARPFFKKLRNRSAALCSLKNWVGLSRQAGALFTAPEEEDKHFFKRLRVFVKNHTLVTIAGVLCGINAGVSAVQLYNEPGKPVQLKALSESVESAHDELRSSVSAHDLADAVVDPAQPEAHVAATVVDLEPAVVLSESDQPSESEYPATSPEKYEPQRSLRGQHSYQDGGYVVTAAMLTEVIKDWQPGRRKKRLMIKTGKDIPEGISITRRRRRRDAWPKTAPETSVLPWSLTAEEATTASESSLSPLVRRRPSPVVAKPAVLEVVVAAPVTPTKPERPCEDVTNISIPIIPIDFSFAMPKEVAPPAARRRARTVAADEDSENKKPISGRRASVISKASSSSQE